MALKDKFRIDELMKKGSKAVRRNPKGDIVVRKIDGKEVRNIEKKKEVPFGLKPIKGKQITEKLKSDFVEIPDEINPQQESFGGETSLYVEKPIYNEEELRKAIDIRVDELIKKKKPVRDEYVRKKLYDDLRKQLREALNAVQIVTNERDNALSQISSLEAEISALNSSIDSLNAQLESLQQQLDGLLERYNTLVADFQNAVIKGTKEGIERVSLTAQVRGLQAQIETLKAQLKAQQDIVKALEAQAKIVEQVEEQEEQQQATTAALQIQGQAGGYGQSGEAGWKRPEGAIDDPNTLASSTFKFNSYRKSSGWVNGTGLDLFNLSEEPVDFRIRVKAGNGDHGDPWIGFSPSSGRINPRSGTTPGKISVTASKVRNVRSPKGRKRTFTDEVTIEIGSETFKLNSNFYRKLRSKGKGN